MISNDPNFATPILPHEDCDCGDLCAWEPKYEWIENPIKRKFMLNLFNRIHGKVYPELEETARKYNLKTFKGLISAWNEVRNYGVDEKSNYWLARWSSTKASAEGDPNFPLNRENWNIAYRCYRIYSAVRVADYKYQTRGQWAIPNDIQFKRDNTGFDRSVSWFKENILYNQLGVIHRVIKHYDSRLTGEPIYYKTYDPKTEWSTQALKGMAVVAWMGMHGDHPDDWNDYDTPPWEEEEEEEE